jgi:glycosyltransferase involved in cell wall biosynthesis
MSKVGICIVNPGLLEAGTKRGGGIEEIDFKISSILSSSYDIIMVSPYYGMYKKETKINKNFLIKEIKFPALKKYPPLSKIEEIYYINLVFVYSMMLCKKMIGILRNNEIKIVIVHNGLPGFFSALISKIMGKKILYSEGNLTPWTNPFLEKKRDSIISLTYFGHLYNLIMGLIITRLSNVIRCQSNSICNGMIRRKVPSKKIVVIGPGVDKNTFYPLNKSEDFHNMTVGFIGRLTREKGVLLLLKVIEASLEIAPNVRFILLGDGPYKNKLLSFPNVKKVGYVPREKLNYWISKLNIVVFFQKDIGLAEIESMIAGKVILACNVGEVPHVIKHLDNGYLCEPDAESYVNSIKKLYENKSLLNKLSTNARKTALNKFTWDVVGKKWIVLCEKLINTGGV